MHSLSLYVTPKVFESSVDPRHLRRHRAVIAAPADVHELAALRWDKFVDDKVVVDGQRVYSKVVVT